MNYVNENGRNGLVYQVTVSKGKGKRTPELEKMLVLIAVNVFRKLEGRYYDRDNAYDVRMYGIMCLLEAWDRVDIRKYNSKLLPFYTEIAKRSFAQGYNLIVLKKKTWQSDIRPVFIRLDLMK